MLKGNRRFGVEIKRVDAPVMTSSLCIALKDLSLEHLVVLYPGATRYSLDKHVTVMPRSTLGQGDAEAALTGTRRDRPKPGTRRG